MPNVNEVTDEEKAMLEELFSNAGAGNDVSNYARVIRDKVNFVIASGGSANPGDVQEALLSVITRQIGIVVVRVTKTASDIAASHQRQAEIMTNAADIVSQGYTAMRELVEELQPYRDELFKLAEQIGDKEDPFAVWETIEEIQRQSDRDKLQIVALHREIDELTRQLSDAKFYSGFNDMDGNRLYLGDRILYRIAGQHTKRDYWNPEYEIIRTKPDAGTFTLRHVGGGLDGGSHDWILRSGQGNGTVQLLARGTAGASQPTVLRERLVDLNDENRLDTNYYEGN